MTVVFGFSTSAESVVDSGVERTEAGAADPGGTRIMQRNASLVRLSAIAVALMAGTSAVAQVAYTDSQGRQWRQANTFAGVNWNQVAAVCPTDGVTPCAGVLAGHAVDGYIWASREDVRELFAEFIPAVAKSGAVFGPQYFLPGLSFLYTFNPTSVTTTTFSEERGLWAWTSTTGSGNKAYAPGATSRTNPFDASMSVNLENTRSEGSASRGVWLYKPAQQPSCPADINGDGSVESADLGALLSAWGTANAAANLDGSGLVDSADLAILLSAWGGC
jgi:hypothetical protein